MDTYKLSVRVPPSLATQAKLLAVIEGATLQDLVVEALRERIALTGHVLDFPVVPRAASPQV